MNIRLHGHGWKALRGIAAAALFLSALIALQAPAQQGAEPVDRPLVLVAEVKGAIGPAMGKHVADAIAAAEERGAHALVLRLNTPGGLATTMREIIAEILASDVPVIGHVAPSGGHAASAGTYILYATHLAAMAPGTNLGAATPVQIGGGGLPLPGGEDKDKPKRDGGKGETTEGQDMPADAMSAKAVNDAVAYIRSLAELRGRNADWAEQAVRQAASLSADAALKEGVIEFVAEDLDELLARADGRKVTVHRRDVTLTTAEARIEHYEVSWQTELLAILTNPNVALILLMLGAYGLIFEFYTPGSIGPGVVGVICLVLGLYALNLLPLNYAGLALILIGIVCMVAEAMLPSFGILGAGGIAAFILGGLLLFETDVPEYQLSLPMLIGSAAVSGGLLVFVLGYVWRAHKKPVVTGTQTLVGRQAEVLRWADGSGMVHVGGERWQAEGPAGLAAGEHAQVLEVRGLTLIVGAAGGEKENAP